MSFLRLGTVCAVFEDDGRVLLSRRGDMDVWNLPTGRLDSGEALSVAAARETQEETGVIVNVDRLVGLYYFEATQRMNILFAGFPVGGGLAEKTDESRDNQYFWLSSMPDSMFAGYMAHDAFEDDSKILRSTNTPNAEIRKIRRKLAWRWVKNLLRGRPEPRHIRFKLTAVALIWDQTHKRVLTMPGKHEQVLPYVQLNGKKAPWVALADGVRRWFGFSPDFSWVGVWQYAEQDTIEFVFATTINEHDIADAHWTGIQNPALVGRDADYVARTPATYRKDRVWMITEQDVPPRQITLE